MESLLVSSGAALAVLVIIMTAHNVVTHQGAVVSDRPGREWTQGEKIFFGCITAWAVTLSIYLNVVAQT